MSTHRSIIDESVLRTLRARVAGDVLTPDEDGYDEACTLWNAAVDRAPGVFVRAHTADDVATAIAAAREHDLPLGVRGGGHHVTGSALVDDGIVVDCTELTDVTIDPDAKTARVEPGARVSDVLAPAQEHGLAPVAGSAAQTGIAGSTLAGGIGWLRREHGLGVDALRSVDLVTADGDRITASATEHSDLFWGIRGAGSNFGVVTSFELELAAVGPEVAIAQPIYALEDAASVLAAYREWAADAPRAVTTLVALMHVPPLPVVPEEAVGAPVVMLFGVYAGDVEDGEAALAPLREFGDPIMDMSGPQPLAGVHEIARDLFPDGRRYSWHSIYATDLADDAIETLVDALANAPTEQCELGVWHLGGAIADVDDDATAFGFRDPEFMLAVDAAWEDPDDDATAIEWARDTWTELRAQAATVDGFYPGFPGFVDDHDERARMAYGDNLDRLRDLKAEYDPENVFASNLNVEPAN
ncbi:FAD-binding oxidoreductase [Halorubellus litoreus]|uniref:FAD-binding oxidoreductase n=1 Tax=Halorubellus litoreus TaxID=755308 RepID=A0ABD5VCA3_9EURY